MSELLPCPFCGGKAHIWNSSYFYSGKCYKCGCTLSGNGYATEAEAIEAWNTRADTATLYEDGFYLHGRKFVPERTCHNISADGFLCSACTFGDFGSFKFEPNYCPNCGAKVVEP